MSEMQLTEMARGHLRLKDGVKSVTIYGEALLRGHGSPDFLMYQNSIEKSDAPNNQQDLTPVEKQQVIHFLKKEFSRRKILLEIK